MYKINTKKMIIMVLALFCFINTAYVMAAPISNFVLTAKAGTTASFAWMPTTGATSLDIEQSTDGTSWSSSTTSTTLASNATSAMVIGLAPATTYHFRLSVTDGTYAGNSNVVIVAIPVLPISDLSATASSNSSADLTWTAATGATNIAVQHSINNGVTWSASTTGVIATNATAVTVTGLQAGTLHLFRLLVSNGANAGISNVASATTVPSPVSTLMYTVKGTNSVVLKWSAAVNATSISVEKSTDGITWTTALNVVKTATGATVTGLLSNQTYQLRLKVIGGGNTGISNVITVTTNGLPVSFTNSSKTSTSAVFKWVRATGASAIVIEQSDDSGATWNTSTTGVIATSATTATVTGLTANTEYQFQVVITGGAYGGRSNIVSLTTTPQAITSLAVTGQTINSADLTWTAATGATNIAVQHSINNGVTWSASTTGVIATNATGVTVTGLQAGTPHQFRLLVSNGANAGISNVATTTTVPSPVSTLMYTVKGTNSVVLKWTAAVNATSISVEKSTDGITWTTALNVVKTATGATVTGLLSNQTYQLRLKVIGGGNTGISNVITVTTNGLPVSFTNSSKTSTSAVFKWVRATGASAIVIEQSDDSGATWNTSTTGVIATSATTATVTGLTANTEYQFQVVITGGAYGGRSNIVSLTTTPQAITSLAVTGQTINSADLTWTAATGATNIAVQHSINNGVTWSASTTGVIATNATGVTVTGLQAGTPHQFRLLVSNGANAGISNVATTTTVPSPVSTLMYTVKGTNSVVLKWTAAVNATSISVEKSTDGITWTTALNVVKTATGATVTGLLSNQTYQLRLKVIGGGNTGISNVITVTTNGLPVSFTNSSKTSTSAVFKWVRATGASAIVIEQSDDSGATWNTSTTGVIATSATTATVTGLTANTEYQFQVVITGGAYGGRSNIVSLTTTPQAITSLAVTGQTINSADLTWTAATGATNIAVQHSINNGVTWSASTTGVIATNATGVTVTGLQAGTPHQFRLLVSNGANAGISNVATTTTVPSPVSTLMYTVKGTNSVVLKWTAAVNATSISVEKSTDGITWTTALNVVKTATGATVTGLLSNQTYQLRLKVIGGVNAGTSNVIAVTTNPSPITSFVVLSRTSNTAVFRWTPANGASQIRIEQFENGVWGSAAAGSISTNANTATVTGLTPGNIYKFRLYVENGQNAGSSNEITVVMLN